MANGGGPPIDNEPTKNMLPSVPPIGLQPPCLDGASALVGRKLPGSGIHASKNPMKVQLAFSNSTDGIDIHPTFHRSDRDFPFFHCFFLSFFLLFEKYFTIDIYSGMDDRRIILKIIKLKKCFMQAFNFCV